MRIGRHQKRLFFNVTKKINKVGYENLKNLLLKQNSSKFHVWRYRIYGFLLFNVTDLYSNIIRFSEECDKVYFCDDGVSKFIKMQILENK